MPNNDWLIPDWPAPAQVKSIFTSRHGGLSLPPFDSFNLAEHVGDEPAHVAKNRACLAEKIAAQPIFLQQVHGTAVLALTAKTAQGLRADASFSTQAQLACTIMVADCLPVLLCRVDGTMVAAAHAGWRGLAGGVLAATLACFDDSTNASAVMAWLGPCIGPQAFEVGPEVKAAFEALPLTGSAAGSCFKPVANGKYLADLPGLARLQLHALGVAQIYGNDGSAGWCTVKQASRYFSHRRDTGVAGLASSGRMAGCIWIA